MNANAHKPQKRRQLFARGLRYLTGGLLVLAGGFTVAKRQRLLREGKCLNRGICGQCQLIDACGLPRALSVKQALRRNAHGE